MDPFSVAATSIGLASSVLKISQSLYNAYDEVRSVGSKLQIFHKELVTLSESLKSLGDGLKRPDFNIAFLTAAPDALDHTEHLSNLKVVLSDCEQSVRQLELILDKICGGGFFAHGILRRPAQALQLDRKTSDLNNIRRQLQTYHNALQLSLHMINILLSANASAKLGALDSRVDDGFSDLKTEIINLRFGLQAFLANSGKEGFLTTNYQKDISKHIQEYVASAESVVSNASDHYKSVAGTVMGTVSNGPISVLGFNSERMQRVETWIPGDSTTDDEIGGEDDEEILIEEAETLRSIAEEGLAAKDYHKAELYFKKFLTTTKDLSTWAENDVLEVEMCLARAYSAQEKHIKARQLLEPYTSKSDLPPSQKFQIAHNVAEACYFESDFVVATFHAKAAFRGRRKLFGTGHPEFQQTASLLVKIYEKDDKPEDAEVYRRLAGVASSISFHEQDFPIPAMSADNVEPAASEMIARSGPLNTIAGSAISQTEEHIALTEEQIALHTIRAWGYEISNAESRNKALGWAVEANNAVMLRILLAHGADIETRFNCSLNQRSGTPLICATRHNHLEILSCLLENGADIEAGTDISSTPLHVAASYGYEAIVRELLKNGAKVDVRNQRDRTPLYHAAQKGAEAVVRLILETGAKIDAVDQYGSTPLRVAASRGNQAVVGVLLDDDAKLDVRDHYGEYLLHTAARAGHQAVVRVLLENGANVDVVDRTGETPLHIAAYAGDQTIVGMLLESEAKVDSKSNYLGATPLYYAVQSGHGAIVRALLEHGANIDPKLAHGKKLLVIAEQTGNQQILKLLQHAKKARYSRWSVSHFK